MVGGDFQKSLQLFALMDIMCLKTTFVLTHQVS